MRIRTLSLLTALLLPISSGAFAQESEPTPESGEMGTGDSSASGAAGSNAEVGTESSAAAPAAAANDGPAKPISVGLLLGYGISLESGGNPWGVGFGARGGYNLGPIYLGARFVFYLGESVESTSGFGMNFSTSIHIWELGVEGGYDLALADKLSLRPELGLGLANSSASSTASGVSASASSTDLYLAPGASVLYDVNDDFYVGGDARLQVVFGDSTVKALIILANGGMHF